MQPERMSLIPLALAAGLAAALGGTAPVRAANTAAAATAAAPDSGDRVSEIIVTAQRREQNIQEVGTSISAFDTHTLESLGLHDVTDVAGQVPGLQFNQYGATVTIYNLRGVSQNDFSDHQEAPVAVYADDAYIANTGALAGAIYDLQRIEVLRGPQGTLFGRNATGGLIHYISAPPTDEFSGYLQATGGNFGTVNTEGAISGPVADKLTARASFSTSYHNGYISNRIGHDINDQKQYAARLQLRYRFSDTGEATLKLHAITNDHETAGNYSWAASAPTDTVPNPGGAINPAPTGRGVFTPGLPDAGGYINPSNDPFVQSEDRRGLFNRTVWGSTLHVNWKFDNFNLVSVTDYLALQKRYGEDSDMSPNPLFNYDTGAHYQQFSEELRANGAVGAVRWIAGVYYLNYHTHNFESTVLPDTIPGIPFPYGRGHTDLALSTSSPSVFGQVEYDIGSHWTGIIGARYTSDEKHYTYAYNCNVCSAVVPNGPYAVVYSTAAGFPDAAKTYHIPTGKVELDYKFNREMMVYGSVNRGSKGGGWSAPSSGYVNLDPNFTGVPYLNLRYNDERLTSYELGAKTTWLDGALRLNGDVFYYDYKQYQGFFLDVATQIVENVNAREKGAELELAAVPVHGLNVQLGVSWLDSEALNIPTNAGIVTVTSELPQAPRWSVNALARYEWPLAGGKLSLEGDVKWNAKQYLELANAPVDLQPSYAVTNARLGYVTADGHWEVALFGHNLADKWYRIYNLDLSGFLGINQGVYGPPRTYGGTVSYHW